MLRKSQGFTLVELIVGIVIVAILAGIAIPSYLYYLQTNRLIGATNSLFYALQYARTEAVRQNTTVYVSFVTGTNWCYGINSGSACTCSTPSSCNLGSTSSTTASGLSLSTTGVSGGSVHFESNHGAAGGSSTITLTVSGQTTSMGVMIKVLGNLQICSNQITGYQSCS